MLSESFEFLNKRTSLFENLNEKVEFVYKINLKFSKI